MNPTLKRVIWFAGIIGIGLIGLMVADQLDFLGGRKDSPSTIGAGPINPNTATVTKPSQKDSGIDGVNEVKKKPSCGKTC